MYAGPFSKELNLAIIRQYGIGALVTKASGGAGGFWDKVEAAREAGCALVVVERPLSGDRKEPGRVKNEFQGGAAVKPKVCLIGVGMGNPATLTAEGGTGD